MKKDQIAKNIGHRVQLLPVAHRVPPDGYPFESIDEDWIIEDVTDEGVRISTPRTGHVATLGFDHVHSYMSNPARTEGGATFGFLMLKVQLFLTPDGVRFKPNARPGEAVPPDPRLEPPNPIRLALFSRLKLSPRQPISESDLPGFRAADVANEIARSCDEGMIVGRVLSHLGGIAGAVALRLTPTGFEWLRKRGSQ